MDLSRVPVPDVVERLDFEAIRAAMIADFTARWPDYTDALESDPAVKLIETAAYRELLLRARINDAAQAGMLASATGADLDGLAARYNTARHPGESDAALRARAQIGFHQVAAAGSRERYLWHALDAHSDIAQADAWQIEPGVVAVSVLARETVPLAGVDEEAAWIGMALFGAGPAGYAHIVAGADSAPLRAARERLFSDEVRPVGVDLRMVDASIQTYVVEGTIHLPPGPDPQIALKTARSRLATYVAEAARFRIDVTRTGIIQALFVDGARDVTLASPTARIARGPGEVAVCVGSGLSVEVADD